MSKSLFKKTATAVAVIGVLGLVTNSASAGVTVGTQSYASGSFSEETIVKEGGNYLMGGLLQAREDLSFSGSSVIKNTVTADPGYVQGGLFKASSANVIVEKNASFTSNKIETTGSYVQGGILLVDTADSVIINQASFNENTINATKGRIQGGILNLDEVKTVSIENAFFNSNTVTAKSYTQGGLITFNNGATDVTNTEFNSNTVSGDFLQGGVILSENDYTKKTASLTIEKSKFNDNVMKAESKVEGGIIQTDNRSGTSSYGKNTLNVTDSAFERNKVTSDSVVNGGLIYHAAKDAGIGEGSLATITKSTFANNTVESKEDLQGGIIHIISGAVMKIDSSSFTNNVATAGEEAVGAVIYNAGTLILSGTNTFTGNTLNGEANDIYNVGTLNIDDTTTIGSGIVNNGTLKLSDKTKLIIGGDSSIAGTFLTEKGSVVTLQNDATLSLSSKTDDTTNGGVIKNLTIQGDGNVDISTSELGTALGIGTNTLDVTSVNINLEGSGKAITTYGTNTITADTITITSKGDGIHAMGDANGAVNLTADTISISAGAGGYAIQNASDNEKENIVINGKNITLTSDGRTAISQQGAGSTVVTAENLVVEGFKESYDSKDNAVNVSNGTLSLNGTETISISNGNGGEGTYAIGVTNDNGKLAVKTPKVTVGGDINAAKGEFQLDGNLIFNGQNATIGNLTGNQATFTVTSSNQNITINNANSALTLAATGDVNDESGISALENITLTGKTEGVQFVAQEGMTNGLVTATLDADGKLTNIVTKVNSIMSNVLDLTSSTTLSLNRILMNDVRKRLGDIRSAEGTHGAWVRYDGGKFSGSNSFENDFHTIQIGVDTAPISNNSRFGVAFSYTKGDADMKRGGAETDAYSLAAYGTWMADNGMFVDVIGRAATIDTDVTIDGNKKGSTDNVALSLSGEMGWRLPLNDKFYVEPQAELTYTYIDSDTLKLNKGISYEIDSVDSLMGRVGFAAGLKCPENKGDVYVRVSAVHEFLGDVAVTAGRNIHEVDGKDTWVEFGIGGQYNVNKNTYIYADVERTSGATLEEDWRANVGLRYSF